MTRHHDKQYLNLVKHVLDNGTLKKNRTGTDTISVFGHTMRFDLRDGTIPLLTSKKMFTRGTIVELLWYLMGSDNVKYLQDNNVHIWDEWADTDGSLHKVYGFQWRHWKQYQPQDWATSIVRGNYGEDSDDIESFYVKDIDQIANLIDKLKNKPDDRRMIVTAWNVADIEEMGLPPCHYSFQCYTRPLSDAERFDLAVLKHYKNEIYEATNDQAINEWLDSVDIPKRELSLILNQRSCDVGLGVPFNIVQYSMLLRMLAHVTNMTPGEFIWNGGDVHIYTNHIEQLTKQLENPIHRSPTLRFARPITNINDFKLEDFIIEGYIPGPKIPMDVAV